MPSAFVGITSFALKIAMVFVANSAENFFLLLINSWLSIGKYFIFDFFKVDKVSKNKGYVY